MHANRASIRHSIGSPVLGLLVALATVVSLLGLAHADQIQLSSGEVVNGRVVGAADGRSFVRLDSGESRWIDTDDIVEIRKEKRRRPAPGPQAGPEGESPSAEGPACAPCKGSGAIACDQCDVPQACTDHVPCPKCYGKGTYTCRVTKCGGRGEWNERRTEYIMGAGGGQRSVTVRVRCRTCAATGTARCSKCRGRGDERCRKCKNTGISKKCLVCSDREELECGRCKGSGVAPAGSAASEGSPGTGVPGSEDLPGFVAEAIVRSQRKRYDLVYVEELSEFHIRNEGVPITPANARLLTTDWEASLEMFKEEAMNAWATPQGRERVINFWDSAVFVRRYTVTSFTVTAAGVEAQVTWVDDEAAAYKSPNDTREIRLKATPTIGDVVEVPCIVTIDAKQLATNIHPFGRAQSFLESMRFELLDAGDAGY